MKTLFTVLIMACALASYPVDAQTPPKPPAPPAAPAVAVTPTDPAAVETANGKLLNIRIDVTVTEEGGTDAPLRKTMSITTADRRPAMVRSAARGTQDGGESQVAIDTRPWVERDGRIRTLVTLNYVSRPYFSNWGQLKFEPLLESGKPLVVSQAPSAVADRRVTVELTATILK